MAVAAVRIGTDLEYAAIHEFGGVITPNTAKHLVFQVDGQWVTTDSVEIPARPYLRPAADQNRRQAFAVAGQVMGRLIERRAR